MNATDLPGIASISQLVSRGDPRFPRPPRSDPDTLRGQYLCESCGDVMTDTVVAASASPTGEEMALCALCQRLS
jgi:hypothetical protein